MCIVPRVNAMINPVKPRVNQSEWNSISGTLQTSDHEGGELTGLTYREMREHSDYSCFLPWGEDQCWKGKVKLLILLDMSISIGGCRLVVIMTSPLGTQGSGGFCCASVNH